MSGTDEYDFSGTQWLKTRGLLDKRKIELGGKVFEARATANAVDNLRALEALNANDVQGFFEVVMDSKAKAKEAASVVQVPLRMADQQAFWAALVTALAGRSPGESSAS